MKLSARWSSQVGVSESLDWLGMGNSWTPTMDDHGERIQNFFKPKTC